MWAVCETHVVDVLGWPCWDGMPTGDFDACTCLLHLEIARCASELYTLGAQLGCSVLCHQPRLTAPFAADGTLVPHSTISMHPSPEVVSIVRSLVSDPLNEVWVISGRKRSELLSWLKVRRRRPRLCCSVRYGLTGLICFGDACSCLMLAASRIAYKRLHWWGQC